MDVKQIKEYKDLLDSGAISEEEYEKLKYEALGIESPREIEAKKKFEEERLKIMEENRIAREKAKLEITNKAKNTTSSFKEIIKKHKKIVSLLVILFIIILLFVFVIYPKYIVPNIEYNKAVRALEDGDWETAESIFNDLDDYKDCDEQLIKCKIAYADELVEEEDYYSAIEVYKEHMDVSGVKGKYEKCCKVIYDEAVGSYKNKDYEKAEERFEYIEDYLDSEQYIKKCKNEIKKIEKEEEESRNHVVATFSADWLYGE